MASKLIECIRSVLHHSGLALEMMPPGRRDRIHRLIYSLRNLKLFVLSARKLGNDASLGSFLANIDDIVSRNAEQLIRAVHPDLPDLAVLRGAVRRFEKDIAFFTKSLDKWYVRFLDTTRQSGSLTIDEILEIIDSFRENLSAINSAFQTPIMETLGEQMAFLHSLIRFFRKINAEPREDLLALTEGVAIKAAHLLLNYRGQFDSELWKISRLVEKMNPTDPRIRETYIEALTTIKLVRKSLDPADQDMDDEAFIATKNMLNVLISFLREVRYMNTRAVVLMRDLYEGLKSLEEIQANEVVLKINEDFVALVCDAGVFIFSSYQTNVQLDLGLLSSLLESIKTILTELGERDLLVPMFNYSRSTTQLDFVDSLLEKLVELKSGYAEPTVRDHAKSVREELVILRSFLGDIVELQYDQQELQTFWDRVLEVAYRVDDVVDYLVVGDTPDCLSKSFEYIMKDIMNIKSDIEVKTPEVKLKRQGIKVKEVTETHSHLQSTTKSLMIKEVVGFNDEAKSIIDRLLRGSKNLKIVAIVGMPGLGKTTFAEKVYDDPSVLHHFSASAFTIVSQTVDKKRVLMDIFKQVDHEKWSRMNVESTADDVVPQLWRSLKGKRYLIILDDLWEAESWQCLRESFPDDSLSSRIMITSRCHDAAPAEMRDGEPHELRRLNEQESLDLLQRRLYGGNFGLPGSGDLEKQFAEKCNGIPLTIVIVAGILKSRDREDWEQIRDSLSNGKLLDRCKDSMELSYKHLPKHLKQCFLYLAKFQEDEKISGRKLIHLWMAEGLVQKVEMQRLSDVAEEYLNDLIGKSLLMVAERKHNGRVRTCRIHDLVHEFCLHKVEAEHFFHFLKGEFDYLLPEFIEPQDLRRLCIYFMPMGPKRYYSRVRSLSFKHFSTQNLWSSIPMSRVLRVLDLEKIHLDCKIPNEIELLLGLAYLAIRSGLDLPLSICNLSNLETFIFLWTGYSRGISLPGKFLNLRKLKHLSIGKAFAMFLVENVDNLPVLYELDRLCGVSLPSYKMEGLMKKFPNIRRLRYELCVQYNNGGNHIQIVLDSLSQLESLDMWWSEYPGSPTGSMFAYNYPEYTLEFRFPKNLKKLTLTQFHLNERNLSSIGKLRNLETLVLGGVNFEGNKWRMDEEEAEEEFSNLRFLKIKSMFLRSWTTSDDQFGCLEELDLSECWDLEEIPDCLENISTLRIIQARNCLEAVVESLKKIGEVSKDTGNSDLKIIVDS